MKPQRFLRRVAFPIILVTGVMIVSINVYNISRHIENRILHSVLSNSGALFMFLSIWLGALFGNTIVLILSFTTVFLMLWNGGHSYYYLYMDIYTKLFL